MHTVICCSVSVRLLNIVDSSELIIKIMSILIAKIYRVIILLGFIINATAYSKYGRTCKDIGCLPNEVCTLVHDSCSYNQQEGDDCGNYPTCKKNGIPIAGQHPDTSSHHSASEADSSPKPNHSVYPTLPKNSNIPKYPINPAPPIGGFGGHNNINTGGYVPTSYVGPNSNGGGGGGGNSGYKPADNNNYPYGHRGSGGNSGNTGTKEESSSSGLGSLLSILGGGGAGSSDSLSSLFKSFGQGGSQGTSSGSGMSSLSGLLNSFGSSGSGSTNSGLSSILSSLGSNSHGSSSPSTSSSSSGLSGILSVLGGNTNTNRGSSSSGSSSSLLSGLSGIFSGNGGSGGGNLQDLLNTRQIFENRRYGGLFAENPKSSMPNSNDGKNISAAKEYPTQPPDPNNVQSGSSLGHSVDANKPHYGWNV